MTGKTIAPALLSTLAALAGCANTQQARYVYQDGEYGVVGIPENTDRWPTRYRGQAEDLMRRHFPDGYRIVRAEEVVEGSRTLVLDAKGTAELEPAVLPAGLLRVAKLGGSTSRQQSDSVKIKECRIIYRKADPAETDLYDPSRPVAYAETPTHSPTLYVDPNAEARRPGDGPSKVAEKDESGPKPGGEAAKETR